MSTPTAVPSPVTAPPTASVGHAATAGSAAEVADPAATVPAPINAVPAPSPLAGQPGMVGIPTVIAGAVGLGLVNVGYVPATAAGAALPTILAATAVGLLITTIWAAALGQNVSASLFAVFFGFYGSYVVLTLGLGHDWYSIPADEVSATVAVWLICWLVTIALLTVVTLRLPSSFTLLLGLVDVALVLLLIGNLTGVAGWDRAGGVVVFAFIAVGVYLYLDLASTQTGGKGLPLGRPLLP